jgi:hypothetical protein
MPISESQLDTWSRQGAVTTSITTHESVRHALAKANWRDGLSYEVYLQGSYKNDTNIYGESDVDIIIEMTSTFYSNLTDEDKGKLGITQASYSVIDFKRDVLQVLKGYYGDGQVTEGNKSLGIKPNSGRLSADVIACATYRWYRSLELDTNGITFWAKDNNQIISYPRLHSEKCTSKNRSTDDRFKPTVRVLKNARSYLNDQGSLDMKLAPSHFIECLTYSLPDNKFETSYQSTLYNILIWFVGFDFNKVTFPSVDKSLFGNGYGQWPIDNAKKFMTALTQLWNNS